MFKLLKTQYQKWQKIGKDKVAHAVKMKKITAAQYKEIVGEPYEVPMADLVPAEPTEDVLTPVEGVED